MTKLSYIWTRNNETKEINTYAELMAQIEKHGGHFEMKYTPIPEPCAGGVSAKRLAVMAENARIKREQERKELGL